MARKTKQPVVQFLDRREVAEILGLMIFTTGPIAHRFRAAGVPIPPKVEDEQAWTLRWLLGLALEHGPSWREIADEQLAAARDTSPKEST